MAFEADKKRTYIVHDSSDKWKQVKSIYILNNENIYIIPFHFIYWKPTPEGQLHNLHKMQIMQYRNMTIQQYRYNIYFHIFEEYHLILRINQTFEF